MTPDALPVPDLGIALSVIAGLFTVVMATFLFYRSPGRFEDFVDEHWGSGTVVDEWALDAFDDARDRSLARE
jgi:hypothetical protein